jgi:hypothetical protein
MTIDSEAKSVRVLVRANTFEAGAGAGARAIYHQCCVSIIGLLQSYES